MTTETKPIFETGAKSRHCRRNPQSIVLAAEFSMTDPEEISLTALFALRLQMILSRL
jgi:hypothetical protein